VSPELQASCSRRCATTTDAQKMSMDVTVMALAATYGGTLVYTSDVGDLQWIAKYSPEVRALGV
jgi:hypothetical protein